MLQFLLNNWEMILTVILAILGAFKIKLNAEQLKAITILWNFIDDVIVQFNTRKPEEIISQLKTKAERSENLKNVIHRIEKTNGDNLHTTVTLLSANYEFLKATKKPVHNLIKKFIYPFGKSIWNKIF